jgi:hypothetical protein
VELGVDGGAIFVDQEVEDLIDQTEGVDLGSADGALGEIDEVSLLVHALGEAAGGEEVRDHGGAAEREERLIELVAIAGGAGDVELAGERGPAKWFGWQGVGQGTLDAPLTRGPAAGLGLKR